MIKLSSVFKLLIFLFIFSSCDQLKKVSEKKPTFSLDFFKKPEPITTNFEDAAKEKVLPDDFGDYLNPTPFDAMPRNENGGYNLSPGFYEMTCKSYCLHPGYGRPGKGDGYLVAPLKGEKTDIITSIIKNAENKNAWQQDVQALLWAVLASTRFDKLSPSLQETASTLLTKKQIQELNKSAVGVIPKEVMQKAQANMPPAVRKAMDLQNKMRSAFEDVNTKYEDLEKLAVPATSLTNDRPEYKRGRWCLHPDGYYIRYFPEGYTATRMQIYIPKSPVHVYSGKQNAFSFFKFVNATTNVNPSGNVAVPANSGQQRLATSSQPKNTTQPKVDKDATRLKTTKEEFAEAIKKGENVFFVGTHIEIKPRPAGVQSHHGVNGAWMTPNYLDYNHDKAPTVYMNHDPNHKATFGVFSKWRTEIKQKQGKANVDYTLVSKEEILIIAEKQFNAADVPQNVRDKYYLAWETYLLTLKKK